MTAAAWATPERASRVLRMFILLLMALIPLAAIYALALGGPPPRADVMLLWRGGPGMRPVGMELPPPPRPGFMQEMCNVEGGVRTCTRTERDLKPGEQPHASLPDAAPPPVQHSGLIKADLSLVTDDTAIPVITRENRGETVTLSTIPRPGGGAPFDIPAPLPGGGVAGLALAVLALLFVLGTLFNIERLLQAFEKGAVFAEATVRRLQHTGIFVAALGFLPQIDTFALLRNAVLSVLTHAPVGPLPMAGGGINLALILAGVFTVLIARIVHEANALAEDVRGTV